MLTVAVICLQAEAEAEEEMKEVEEPTEETADSGGQE